MVAVCLRMDCICCAIEASIWLRAFSWSEVGRAAGVACFRESGWSAAAWPVRTAECPAAACLAAGVAAGAVTALCAKRIPLQIAAMADKRDRPGTNLAEVNIMEINNVNSTAVLLASPIAETKQHAAPELIQAVKAVNGAKLFGQDSELSFVLDRETKRLVVRLVDKDSRKVIRQVPAEEVLRRAEALREV